MPKVETIEQFKIMQFLDKHLKLNQFSIELVDRSTVKVTDSKYGTMIFRYENGSITWK